MNYTSLRESIRLYLQQHPTSDASVDEDPNFLHCLIDFAIRTQVLDHPNRCVLRSIHKAELETFRRLCGDSANIYEFAGITPVANSVNTIASTPPTSPSPAQTKNDNGAFAAIAVEPTPAAESAPTYAQVASRKVLVSLLQRTFALKKPIIIKDEWIKPICTVGQMIRSIDATIPLPNNQAGAVVPSHDLASLQAENARLHALIANLLRNQQEEASDGFVSRTCVISSRFGP